MNMRASFALTLAAAIGAAACNGSPAGPSSLGLPVASAPPAPAPPGPLNITGDVMLRSLTPESGATVHVRNCGLLGALLDMNRPAHSLIICSDEVRATFEILVNRDIPNAVVTLDFVNDTEECAQVRTVPTALTAGVPTLVTTSRLGLYTTTPYGADEYVSCSLPTSTSRMILGLQLANSATSLLPVQESEHFYRFDWQ